MIYDYDLEFLENGRTIELISIGIVAEDGREYYAVNRDAPWHRIRQHEWLMANVVPHLPTLPNYQYPPLLDLEHPAVKHRARIAADVHAFIAAGAAHRDDNQLWAWYGAYDHVALCQLWGRMIDLPEAVPMFTHDLKAFADDFERASGWRVKLPAKSADEHNALVDARWNREARQKWRAARRLFTQTVG